jgi:transcriptional regulator with XRE-family HTH domain
MSQKNESFDELLRRHRCARKQLSVRKLATLSGVEYSLISKLENGKKSAGPATVEKLANALRLVGAQRDEFVKAGCAQSKRSAQALGPTMANPFFRAVLGELLRTLGFTGEVMEFRAEPPSDHGVARYDFSVTLVDGKRLGIDFKNEKILVVVADSKNQKLPAPTEAAAVASGGVVATLTFNRGNGEK